MLATLIASRATALAAMLIVRGGNLPVVIAIAGSYYDASWYERVVRWSYAGTTLQYPVAARYPGYPLVVAALFWPVALAIRILAPRESLDSIAFNWGLLHLCMLIVANAALVVAILGFWRLYQGRLGRLATTLGICFLVAEPAGIFLSLGFSESLFLAAVAWAFVFATEGRWVLAGALAAVACVTRLPGAFLLAPLALIWLEARPRPARSALVGLGAFAAGVAAFPLFLWVAFGDPFLYFHLQAKGHQLTNPVGSLVQVFSQGLDAYRALRGHPVGVRPVDVPSFLLIAVGTIAALLTLLAGWRRLRPWELSWVALVLLFPLLTTSGTAGMNRYLLTAFPMFFLFGWWLRRWPLAAVGLVAVSIGFTFVIGQTMARGFYVA